MSQSVYRPMFVFIASLRALYSAHDAAAIASRLREHRILVKPLGDARLGAGFMRVTTALPEDNARFVAALEEIL